MQPWPEGRLTTQEGRQLDAISKDNGGGSGGNYSGYRAVRPRREGEGGGRVARPGPARRRVMNGMHLHKAR